MSNDTPKSLKEAIISLELSGANASMVIANLDPTDWTKILVAFGALHDAKKQIEAVQTFINGIYRKLSEETVPDALEAAGIDSINDSVVIGGKRFSVSTRINASIPAAKKDAGFDWLRNVAKCGDIINESVNARQLSSFIENYFEEHAELPPEEAITVHLQKFTSIRKAS